MWNQVIKALTPSPSVLLKIPPFILSIYTPTGHNWHNPLKKCSKVIKSKAKKTSSVPYSVCVCEGGGDYSMQWACQTWAPISRPTMLITLQCHLLFCFFWIMVMDTFMLGKYKHWNCVPCTNGHNSVYTLCIGPMHVSACNNNIGYVKWQTGWEAFNERWSLKKEEWTSVRTTTSCQWSDVVGPHDWLQIGDYCTMLTVDCCCFVCL